MRIARAGQTLMILLFAALFWCRCRPRVRPLRLGGTPIKGGWTVDEKQSRAMVSKETGIKVNYIARPLDASQTLALWQQNWAAQTPDIDVYIIDVIWPGIAAAHATDLKEYFTPEGTKRVLPAHRGEQHRKWQAGCHSFLY